MIKQLQISTRPGLLLAVLVLTWMVIHPGYSQTCGLVSNSGFESGNFTGWTASTGTSPTIVTDVHSGTKAARLSQEGGLNSASTFAVTAGQTLTFQVWAKVSGSPSWAGVGVDFLKADNSEDSEFNLQVTSTSYGLLTATKVVPAGVTKVSIWSWKSGATGNLFLDDFCISMPDTRAPTAPLGLGASNITQTSFTFTWNAASDNVGVTGYEVFRDGTSIGTTSSTSMSVTNLRPATNYAMRVRARDAAGNWSALSSTLNVPTSDTSSPSVPTGLSASAVTQTSFTLNWAASTDNVAVTGYEVFRDGAPMGPTTSTSMSLTNLVAGTTYAMRVVARDAAGNRSAQSAALNVTTASAVTSCGSISNTSFENNLTSWSNDNNATAITTDAHTGTKAANTGPAHGGLHYSGSTISVVAGQTVTVTLFAKTSGNPIWAGYGLDYFDGTGTEVDGADATITGTTYSQFSIISKVPSGATTVSFWTYKDGETGNLFVDDVCLTVSGTPDTQAPTAPSNLVSSNITSSSFTLSWNSSTDETGGSGIFGYEIFSNGTSIGTSTIPTFNVPSLAPATTYAMRVRGRDGAGNWSALSAILNVTTLGSSTPGARVNNMGINLDGSGGLDYNSDKPWADAMRSHRWMSKARNSSTSDDANKDANYWPTEDARCLVWSGLNTHDNHGTYRLYFTGSATVTAEGGTIQNVNYNSATNTTTADLVITDQNNRELYLIFTNTKRTASSATNTGLTNIKLMRPVSPGSSQSYATNKDFTDQFLAALANFSTIRYMDFTATNENGDEVWADRTKWTDARQSPPLLPGRSYGWQGRGASWESIIKLANASGKDAWICIPHKVNEDYITNLAALFKNGNDQTPGLNANLKLYIEYSNEVWNPGGGFGQTQWVYNKGVSYGAPLNFDGETNDLTLGQRYKAMMTVRASEIFRSTFGDAQMMTRIRPVLMWQKSWNDLANRIFSFIDGYYNKRDSRSNRSTPHPVNYYVWGGGASTYFNTDPDAPVPTINQIWEAGTFNVSNFYNTIDNDANFAKIYGLQYASYEGNSHPSYNGDEDVINQACLDPRMKNELKEHHYAFSQLDGDLLCYFNMTGLPFGLAAANIEDINTPKFQAIGELKNETPQAVNYGPVPPFSRRGGDTNVFSYFEDAANAGGSITLTSINPSVSDPNEAEVKYYSGYTFHVNSSGNYTVQVEYSTTKTATLVVEFNGAVIQTANLSNTNGAAANTTAVTVSCATNKLHGIRLVCTAGDVTIRFVKVNPVAAGARMAEQGLSTISASPNPIASGKIMEVSGLDEHAPSTIQIVDMSGTVKYKGSVDNGDVSHTVNTLGLAKGIYILKVTTKENTVNKRIVIE